jgi:hypothetical protein
MVHTGSLIALVDEAIHRLGPTTGMMMNASHKIAPRAKAAEQQKKKNTISNLMTADCLCIGPDTPVITSW